MCVHPRLGTSATQQMLLTCSICPLKLDYRMATNRYYTCTHFEHTPWWLLNEQCWFGQVMRSMRTVRDSAIANDSATVDANGNANDQRWRIRWPPRGKQMRCTWPNWYFCTNDDSFRYQVARYVQNKNMSLNNNIFIKYLIHIQLYTVKHL